MGAKMVSKWAKMAPDGPRWPKDAPRSPQDGPKYLDAFRPSEWVGGFCIVFIIETRAL